jgi:phosphate acetyltransferase
MILSTIRERAALARRTVVFPDALDVRTLEAVVTLAREGTCIPMLVGNTQQIVDLADASGVAISGIRIVDPDRAFDIGECTELLLQRRSSKGLTPEVAAATARQPLMYAGWLVASGHADAAVAGSLSTTADVVRAGLWTIGLADGCNTVSSYFLMALGEKTLFYTDAGVVPAPTVTQLVDIASAAADNYQAVTGDAPRCAFLSFSTKGSAAHPLVDHVRDAAEMFAQRRPDIVSDGELQADAAIVPSVAARKAPLSPLHGQANVLVFPDLNAGNIAYKLTERLGGATAVGPIIQGLAKPYCDLSRGCSSEDIRHVAAIAALMAS